MFRGATSLMLDTKGRFAIPAKYRESLAESCASQLVITIERDGCLLIYPKPEWEKIESQINALPSFNPTARALRRLYIGNALEVEMDSQGRVLLSPNLRTHASLDKRLALVGQGSRFELWDEDIWERKKNEWLDEVSQGDLELPPELATLSL